MTMTLKFEMAYQFVTNTLPAQLGGYGVEPPKALADALAEFDAMQAAVAEAADLGDVTADVHILASKPTPGGIEALIEQAVQRHLHRTALTAVQPAIIEAYARRVVLAGQQAGPEIIGALGVHFDPAAERFTEAYRALPAQWDNPEALVRAGSRALAVYEQAVSAHAELESLRLLRQGFEMMLGVGHVAGGAGPVGLATRYVRVTPPSRKMLTTVGHILQGGRTSNLHPWAEVLGVAGVELAWSSIEQQKATLAQLPQPEAPPRKKPSRDRWADPPARLVG